MNFGPFMGDLREPNVAVTEERPVSSPLSPSNPSSSSIGAERWARAEKATGKIICQVQPTAVSEDRRREVIDYVQRLIRGYLQCEVLPYGSVPLKTYLPDGDIDLTAFGGASVEDALANDMVSILAGEDQNSAVEFVVKDVQLIHAEVKLVKCIVQNIAVDISFNQIGGLCTLCFLEQVDRFIGKDHLFKRSIILIKAWCYYESRILGAHHGLISTYALETLVLHIFHVFHSTLDGPLAVLYKFLDYFSKFNWDKYCVSLTGPVHISSLPEIVVEAPENGGGDLLLSNDFLRYCVEMFSVPSKGVDANSRTFPQKHLNIVDPLKENNNLGRSVSKGNFYRIRSAFTYGARKLGGILMHPEDKIADELNIFFSNTLERHGGGQRPDVHDPVPISSYSGFGPAFSIAETESCQEEKVISESKIPNCIGTAGDYKHNPDESAPHGVNNIAASGTEMKFSRTANGQDRGGSMKAFHSTTLPEVNGSAKGRSLLGYRFSGDAEDLATSRIQGLKISNGSPKVSRPSGEESVSPLGGAHHAPHLYFSNSVLCNGSLKYGNSDTKKSQKYENKVSSGVLQAPDEGQSVIFDEALAPVGSKDVISASNSVASLEDSHPVNCDWASASRNGTIESMNSLSDLSGDYESHLDYLQYGRYCYEYPSSVRALPMPPPPPPPSHFHSMNSWNAIHRSSQFMRNGFSNGAVNGAIPGPVIYHMDPLLIPGVAPGRDEMPKPRGTGTYFPNMNRPPQGYRPSTVKGWNQGPVRSPRNNGRAMTFIEFPIEQAGGSSDIHQSYSPRRNVHPTVNGLTLQSEGVGEFGSAAHTQLVVPLLESTRQQKPASPLPQTSTQGLPGMQRTKPVLGMDQDRFMMKSSYHLKDEEDFPPLSV